MNEDMSVRTVVLPGASLLCVTQSLCLSVSLSLSLSVRACARVPLAVRRWSCRRLSLLLLLLCCALSFVAELLRLTGKMTEEISASAEFPSQP